MKIALCISGLPRFVEQGYPSIYKNFIEPYDSDVFIHTWTKDVSPQLLTKIKELYQPVMMETNECHIPIYDYTTLPYAWGSRPIYNMFSMHESIYKANQLRKVYEEKNNIQYDCVIRCRFDLQFQEKIDISMFDLASIHAKHEYHYKHNDLHDQFAFSKKENMDIYCNCYNNILHVFHSLKENNFIQAPENILLSPEIILGNYLRHFQKIPIVTHSLDFHIIR